VICYRGLSVPQRALLHHALGIDAACTSLSGHCARKSAVLVIVCCYKARGDGEQDLWRYWLPAGYIKQWCDKPTGDGCLSKRCELGEQWNSNIAVSRTLAKHFDIQSENIRVEPWWFTPLTTLSIQTADKYLLPLLFLRSFSISSGCPFINIHSSHQHMKLLWFGPMTYHPHNWFSLLQTSYLSVLWLWLV